MLRGHDADHDFCAIERGVQVAGRRNRFGQEEPRQEAFVDSASCDAFGNFRFVRPEPDLVCPFTSQDDCQSSAPGARADDGNTAHGRVAPEVPGSFPESVAIFVPVPNFVPNLDSVPAARRPMFWRCLQMTSAETAAINSNCRGSAYSRKAHASSGKAAATATDPSETKRNATARIKNRPTMHKIDSGVSKIKAPKLVATPLPPRNLSQTGNRWPSTAKNAAVVMMSG